MVIIWRPYKSLKGYLERFTLLKVGRLHIRWHRIDQDDATGCVHTHPFSYISIIVKGGYTDVSAGSLNEKMRMHCLSHQHQLPSAHPLTYKVVRAGTILVRRWSCAHRLEQVKPGTCTLFIAWSTRSGRWDLWNIGNPKKNSDRMTGIYMRQLYGKQLYCKWQYGIWFMGSLRARDAQVQTQPSIDQSTDGVWFRSLEGACEA